MGPKAFFWNLSGEIVVSPISSGRMVCIIVICENLPIREFRDIHGVAGKQALMEAMLGSPI
jgi:hypothetical protein